MARAAAFARRRPAAAAFARDELARRGGGVVVKADGLAAGKGVTVCDEPRTRRVAAIDAGCFAATGAARVVVEERLDGPRGEPHRAVRRARRASRCPPARDHKRLFDGDRGPNTGGMGAYSPLPDLPDDGRRADPRPRSTGRSSPSWPGAGPRSVAPSTPA